MVISTVPTPPKNCFDEFQNPLNILKALSRAKEMARWAKATSKVDKPVFDPKNVYDGRRELIPASYL